MASHDENKHGETSSLHNEKVERTQSGTGSVMQGTITHTSQLHRNLGNRQIQLIAIGGSVGTAVFVSIGTGLAHGGPGSLFLAYTIYSCMVGLVNNCMAEMTVYHPISGAFIRMAGHWVDESFGFMVGWNFFLYEALLVPFEISALNLVLKFWRDDIPVAAVVAICIVLYGLINVGAVKWFGEAEFWLSIGKVILFFIVFFFTFITMVGGNPQKDAYGFRYWKNPGSFAEHITTGDLGRFEGFLGSLWIAAFTCVGPEYVSMIAGEAKLPRVYIKNAFKTTYIRFGIFFILSSLCVGIIIPYDDPTLVSVTGGGEGAGTGAASPYVIAMGNLGIGVLPHIVNGLLVSSIFSAGNALTYYGTRSLYGLALEGQAPRFLLKCTSFGLPIYCLGIVMIFPFLAFLAVSNDSAVVLTWLTNIITAAQIIDHIVISITYIFFYRACKAQGIDRKTLPYYGWFQPYSAWISAAFLICVVFCYGYTTFLPGNFTPDGFFTYYTMLIIAPITFFGWKFTKKTKFIEPSEADLVWERPQIDAYEAAFEEVPVGFWMEIIQLFGFKRNKSNATA
ncbi:amino acid permease/ SLC12A domain-containing protein [Fusarium flagelliforme]|uniref:amino acid permease/ SLC12A domain-containing protein n=1 Tax=Fusarium flagelliforme TaxID=2675880 RepID=UPI001E8CA486|nr:amino acid permease/ SLC12A domain-containing protein [Fusarium flagelliforme]KAH7186253.1 amino acid permease/ SLC12A domain-containing protein [Fusarium flagelliforme]